MQSGDCRPISPAHKFLTVGLKCKKTRSNVSKLDMYLSILTARKAHMVSTGNLNKPCDTPFVKNRSTGHMGYAFEFLIYLDAISDTIHSMVFLLRPHESECIDSNFSVDCAAVKNISVSNYATNIIHEYFDLLYKVASEYENNFFFIGKIFRDSSSPSRWKIHLVGYDDSTVNSELETLRDSAFMHMVDIYPHLKESQVTIFATTEELCSAIRSDEFPALEKQFPHRGLPKEDFVKLLLRQLLLSRPFLQEYNKVASIAKLLSDLFEQIDINEDLKVDWDEFTSFCVMLGMISTNQQKLFKPTDLVHESYRQQELECTSSFDPRSVRKMKYISENHKIIIIPNLSPSVVVFSMDGRYLHDFKSIDTSIDKVDSCVLDIAHIVHDRQNMYAVSSSGHYIALWNIINSTRGLYVLVKRLPTRETQLCVKWSASLKALISFGSRNALLIWSIDMERPTNVATHHKDYITDAIDIPDHNLVATCSLDRRILMWHADTLKLSYVMKGHKQGIRALTYARSILVSCGFEHQAYCWYIPKETHTMVLGGHAEPLIGVKLLTADPNILRCITGDSSGRFKVWDISRCSRSTKSVALVLQSFQYTHRISSNSFRDAIKSFEVVPDTSRLSISGTFHDIVTLDSKGLLRYRVEPITMDELEPPRNVVYNSVCNIFCGTVKRAIRIWDAQRGKMVQELVKIDDGDVTCLIFAQPRQRKLFVATDTGCVAMYNSVNGSRMTEQYLHADAVTGIVYCQYTQCIITVGKDRKISVSHDVPGSEKITPLRTLDNAHDHTISTLAYMYELSLIATGDSYGVLRIWDFVSLRLDCFCRGHRSDITHMQFSETGLLVSSDTTGDIFVWRTRNRQGGNILCLAQLIVQPRKCLSEVLPSINSFCFLDTGDIVAGNDTGRIFVWTKKQYRRLVKDRGLDNYFENIHRVEQIPRRSDFQPYRASTKSFNMETASRGQKKGLLFQRVQREKKRKQSLRGSLEIPPCFKWKGHGDSITKVSAIKTAVFTTSVDLSVKVWDIGGSCLGAFYSEDICLRNIKTRIPWTFGSHCISKPTQEHFDIAQHVLETTDWEDVQNPQDTTLRVTSGRYRMNTPVFSRNNLYTPKTATRKTQLYRLSKRKKPPPTVVELSRSMNAIVSEATKQKAFSQHSISIGTSSGLFGGEELLALQSLLNRATGIDAYTKPGTPLLLSNTTLQQSKGAQRFQKVSDMPVLRLCDNFAEQHIENVRSRIHSSVVNDDLIEASNFLKERLNLEHSPAYQVRQYARFETATHQQTNPRRRETIKTLPAMKKSFSVQDLSEQDRRSLRAKVTSKIGLATELYDDCRIFSAPKHKKKAHKKRDRERPCTDFAELNLKNPYAPYYRVQDILDFGEVLSQFDNDGSGDIDKSEWSEILTIFREKESNAKLVTDQLFLAIDKNDDGTVSVMELLSVVFDKANKLQLRHMEAVLRGDIVIGKSTSNQ